MSDSHKHDADITSFFILPGNAIRSLRDELQISIGEDDAEGILERYGYRCGEGMIEDMKLECKNVNALAEALDALWAEIGLGRTSVKTVLKDEITISFEETPRGGCNFVKGYLQGASEKLTNKRFYCFEEKCTIKGDKACTYRLIPAPEYVKPVAEKKVQTKRKYALEEGTSYLIEGDSLATGYDIFVDFVTHGGQGLVITRDYPERVRKRYDLRRVPILWLTDVEKEYAINPVELGKLYYELESFLKKGENTMILFIGLEYLISQNSFKSVLKFLQLAKDQIAIYGSILTVPVSAEALEDKALKQIERELEVFK